MNILNIYSNFLQTRRFLQIVRILLRHGYKNWYLNTKMGKRYLRRHPDVQYLFLVPEQYTMQTQREIVRLHPRHGVMNIDILSFKRLAYRVFEDLGVQVPVGSM